MDEKWDLKEIQKQFKALQLENEQYAQENKKIKNDKRELQEQNQSLTEKLNAMSSSKSIQPIEHSIEFWVNIKSGCAKKTGPFGTDSIKTMIKTGKMTVYDIDQTIDNRPLLHIAACCGAYDFAQLLINNVE